MGGAGSYTGEVGRLCVLLRAKDAVEIDAKDPSESLGIQFSWLSVSESVSVDPLRL